MVDPTKDTGSFVLGIVRAGPGQIILGYSDILSFDQYMELWGKINNVPARFKQTTVEHYESVPVLGKMFGDMFAYSAEFGYDGNKLANKAAKDVSC
jgi:hypothetical protein